LLKGLAALLLLAFSSAQDYRDLEIGDLSRNHRIESDETKFFRVKVSQRDYDREKDLVIKVFSEGQIQGDPDVYISRVSVNARNRSLYRQTRSLTDSKTVSGHAPRTEKILARFLERSSGQMTFSTSV
jgi:hypothetical protein